VTPGGALGARTVGAALAALVLALAVVDVELAPGDPLALVAGPEATAIGVLAAFVQAGLVLWCRERPRLSLALLACLAPVQFALIGLAPGYVWGVLAYAAARAPGRAAGWITGSALLPLVPAVGWIIWSAPSLPAVVGGVTTLAAQASVGGLYIVVGAGVGRVARTTAARLAERRDAAEYARRGAALVDERARIADEIGDGVLVGLRGLVERVEDLSGRAGTAGDGDRHELKTVHEHARSVLAAMRRVLQALRGPESGPDRAVIAPARTRSAGGPQRRPLPAPDRVGMLTVAVLVVFAGLVTGSPGAIDPGDRFDQMLLVPWSDPMALALLFGQIAALGWWRTAPVPSALLVAVGSAAAAASGTGNLFADVAWLLAVWGVATRVPTVRSAIAATVATLLVLLGAAVSGVLFGYVLGGVGQAVVVLAPVPLLWTTGVQVRRHRERLARARLDEALAAERRLLAEERMRVARELHDVVAHHVSAVAVQAGAARVLPDRDAVAEAVAHMCDSARRIAAALPELADLTPTTGGVVLDAAGVEDLVAPARQAGVPVLARVLGDPADLPGDAELFAQRVLVEALTNVVRHAGPSPTTVEVHHDTEEVVVTVRDEGRAPGHRPPTSGSGLGVVGMRERVALLGGRCEAGPHGPGWRVRVALRRPEHV